MQTLLRNFFLVSRYVLAIGRTVIFPKPVNASCHSARAVILFLINYVHVHAHTHTKGRGLFDFQHGNITNGRG